MLDGLRKVVHIEVFDFDSDTYAYAKESHKNQFGYSYQTKFLKGDTVVRETPKVNNVERGAFYNRKLGLNLSQLKSLRKRINSLLKTKKGMYPFDDKDGVNVLFRGGSIITYRGKNTDDFYQKVLRMK